MNSIVAFADCFILMKKSWYLSFPQFEYYSLKQNWKMSRIRSSFSCGYKTSKNKKKKAILLPQLIPWSWKAVCSFNERLRSSSSAVCVLIDWKLMTVQFCVASCFNQIWVDVIFLSCLNCITLDYTVNKFRFLTVIINDVQTLLIIVLKTVPTFHLSTRDDCLHNE